MKIKSTIIAGAALATLSAFAAQAADTIKIGFIDPLSGPFAATGTNGLAQFRYAVDELVNKKGGVLGGTEFEIVAYDNKISPKESLIQLKRAIGEGVRYIAQGNSSGVANALTDAIKKHNKRNPDNRVLFLNYSAVDPALTNAKCNFWHFRFDANADIKMNALTDVIKVKKDIKKIYLIGQDYSFGKSVAAAAVRFLKEKRPDVVIVGNELHPIGKVKDFTPYATKIRASGADAVITGNWGADMIGLGKAIGETGLDVPIYTYYAANDGITKTIGASGKNKIRLVHEGPLNPPSSAAYEAYHKGFKAKNPEKDISQFRIANTVQMLAAAIEKAGNAQPINVAKALEGMEFTSLHGETLTMRAEDHQMIQPIHISVHTDEGITFDSDNSGYGLSTETTVAAADTALPTTCKMKRPM
ncbi:branched-chain amino acid ABC transporter substrate-binding protein [Alphaproteobacteria bacterium 46_93_T64]|nr:branched-chain amino acid ABC transporter substrate-binding protein [Alphaproteobacteria bacterium 46_93_T64]